MNQFKKHITFLLCTICILCTLSTHAQNVLLDRGIVVEVNGRKLWCYPLATDTLTYKYLPNKASLSKENGKPQFSFTKYIINHKSAKTEKGIQTLDGGAIVHFLVEYDTPQSEVTSAERQLQRILKNKEIKLTSPIAFKDGNHVVVSSLVNENKILSIGTPVMAGSKLAFSFELKRDDANILLATMKTNAADISIVFDLVFAGLTDSYKADMIINWEKIYKHKKKKKKSGFLFVKKETEKFTSELLQNNSIELKEYGKNENLENMMSRVYDKAVNFLFEPMTFQEVQQTAPKESNNQLGEIAKGLLNQATGGATAASFSKGYKFKKVKQEGQTTVSFSSAEISDRHHILTFNLAGLFKQYGNDTTIFQTINLFDPHFMQRTIDVTVDGKIKPVLNSIVDEIIVKVRKKHDSNKVSYAECKLRENVLQNKKVQLFYGFDENPKNFKWSDWLNYEYQVVWSFVGTDSLYRTSWKSQNEMLIKTYLPFKNRKIYLDGDLEKIWEKGVSSIQVNVAHDFYGRNIEETIFIRKGKQNVNDLFFEIPIQEEENEYQYEVVYFIDGKPIPYEGTNRYLSLSIDQILIDE